MWHLIWVCIVGSDLSVQIISVHIVCPLAESFQRGVPRAIKLKLKEKVTKRDFIDKVLDQPVTDKILDKPGIQNLVVPLQIDW